MDDLTKNLLVLKEQAYSDFSKKLVPDTKFEILGVRLPLIKKLAKKAIKTNLSSVDEFFTQNHVYYEQWILYGFLLSYEQNIDVLFKKLDSFLPNVDNWAVCDCVVASLKILRKYPEKTFSKVKEYATSNNPYTVRFAIVILLDYFLEENFNNEILLVTQSIKSEHYYINMGLAWFYSIALIKQYDSAIKIIESKTLDKFVHNKSIQKAIESFRIPDGKKSFLRKLKI